MKDTEINNESEIPEQVKVLSDSIGVRFAFAEEVEGELDIPKCQRIIEAVLYAAGHPVTYSKIAEVIGCGEKKARDIVNDYAEIYNSPESGTERGIVLLCYDECCQLSTREEYGEYVKNALGIRRGGVLSASSLEVLAIVAYNEPVTRAYVDLVRGVDSSYAVSSLTDKHMLEVCGRLDVPGRPLLYRTTPDFLRVFGLNSLAELPKIDAPAPVMEGEIIPIEGLDETIPTDNMGMQDDGYIKATDGTVEFTQSETEEIADSLSGEIEP